MSVKRSLELINTFSRFSYCFLGRISCVFLLTILVKPIIEFNGFRSSLGPIEKTHFVVARGDKVNLDLLPAGIRVFFKLIYLGVSLSTLVLCLIHVTSNLLKGRGGKTAFYIIVILCYSFYATNFMFATMMDANRFNYPSEPLMLLLFIYNINILFRREDLSMARNNRWDLFCS